MREDEERIHKVHSTLQLIKYEIKKFKSKQNEVEELKKELNDLRNEMKKKDDGIKEQLDEVRRAIEKNKEFNPNELSDLEDKRTEMDNLKSELRCINSAEEMPNTIDNIEERPL